MRRKVTDFSGITAERILRDIWEAQNIFIEEQDSFELGLPVYKLVSASPYLWDEDELGLFAETAVSVDLSCGKQR